MTRRDWEYLLRLGRGIARREGFSREEADDIASEAALRVVRLVGRGEEVLKVPAVCLGAVRWAIVDAIRLRRRPPPLALEEHDASVDPEDGYAFKEIYERALSRLSPSDSRIIQALSRDTIHAVLDEEERHRPSRGAAKVAVHRARRAFLGVLRNELWLARGQDP